MKFIRRKTMRTGPFVPGALAAAVLLGGWSGGPARADDAALVLKGHAGPVWGAALSPGGKRIASASGDKTARVWDPATGQELLSLQGHTAVVSSVAFSPDARRLVTAAGDNTVRVWDAATGRELLTLQGHKGWVYGAVFGP